jgi:hypothetical protein
VAGTYSQPPTATLRPPNQQAQVATAEWSVVAASRHQLSYDELSRASRARSQQRSLTTSEAAERATAVRARPLSQALPTRAEGLPKIVFRLFRDILAASSPSYHDWLEGNCAMHGSRTNTRQPQDPYRYCTRGSDPAL